MPHAAWWGNEDALLTSQGRTAHDFEFHSTFFAAPYAVRPLHGLMNVQACITH
jgi:hypothetical protein